jgi:AcrR family transcriptional regulator
LRADAERNRQRIIDAASRLFKRAGIDVPLEDIAREAGVGIGTLYRRFPHRSQLTAAAFAQQISAYLDVVDAAAGRQDPWEGMNQLIYGLCKLQADDAGLRDFVTMSYPDTPEIQDLLDNAQAKLEALIERAKESGGLRSDATSADILFVLLGNAGIVARSWAPSDAVWRRFAALCLDGLRRHPDAKPLPPAPSADTIREVLGKPNA